MQFRVWGLCPPPWRAHPLPHSQRMKILSLVAPHSETETRGETRTKPPTVLGWGRSPDPARRPPCPCVRGPSWARLESAGLRSTPGREAQRAGSTPSPRSLSPPSVSLPTALARVTGRHPGWTEAMGSADFLRRSTPCPSWARQTLRYSDGASRPEPFTRFPAEESHCTGAPRSTLVASGRWVAVRGSFRGNNRVDHVQPPHREAAARGPVPTPRPCPPA